MKKFKLISFTAVLLALSVFCVAAKEAAVPTGYTQSLLNICDYGAIPNDGKDDTSAFLITLNQGSSVYVPAGEFMITESLFINSTTLIGCGTEKTVIIADIESTRDPIIWAGDRSQIRDLTIKYADGRVTGSEIAGERAGIVTSAKGVRRLCRCAGIMNVSIQNVGTGLYAPLSSTLEQYRKKAAKSNGNWSGDACAFSVTFESISVVDFSYRGVDIEATGRTGNIYRNIYISSGKHEANAGFYLNTNESETSVTDLTVADSNLKTPVRFTNIYALDVTNINFINTKLSEDNTAFIYFENTVARIGGLIFRNSAPEGERQSFIRAGSNAYNNFEFPNLGYVHIENMSIINPDIDVQPDSGQYMIARKNKYLNEFTFVIENYIVNAPEQLKAQYQNFKIDNRELNVTVGGEKK